MYYTKIRLNNGAKVLAAVILAYNIAANMAQLVDKTIQAPSPSDLKGTFIAPSPGETANPSSTSSTPPDSSPPTTVTLTTPLSSTTSAPASSTSQGAAQNHASSLGDGAKAGIGVGAAVAGLSLIAILLFLFWRQRKSRKNVNIKSEKPSEEMSRTNSSGRIPTIPSNAAAVSEMDSNQDVMLDSKQNVELDSWVRHEADADGRERTYEMA
ncbi:MAG: hypothetical protein Q9213_007207 [Squamulea squamosa]